MPFIGEILKYGSVSIVGLAKNAGKTECLNYIIRKLPLDYFNVAVTSIGIDGESLDQVTSTAKPEISVREGMFFGTSEKHYRQRKLLSEIYDVSDETTALGRVVTAKALTEGKVLLSGPSSGSALKRWMGSLKKTGADLILVDGALSRLSTASPAISEAMVLSTGAALSSNIRDLVAKTAYVVELVNLPLHYHEGEKDDVDISVSSFVDVESEELRNSRVIEVEGALTDRLMQAIRGLLDSAPREIVVKDFTRIFVSADIFRSFIRRGGKVTVRMKSNLLAVCVNPVAPNGIVLDSDLLCDTMSKAIGLPVYDIVKNEYEIQGNN